MGASWTWLLADSAGNALAELTTASGRQITFTRNTFAEAQFTVSHKDDAAALLLNAVAVGGLPTLRCYRRSAGATASALRFNGYLAPFQESADEAATLTAVFRSPFAQLLGDGSSRGRFTDPVISCVGVDAGAIAQSLINVYGGAGTVGATDSTFGVTITEDSFCGLATTGAIEATVPRTRTYQSANVGQAIIDGSTVLDGYDFAEEFLDAGRTLAQLNIYAKQGTDRPDARFEYGPGTLANVASMTRTTEPPRNCVRVLGGNGLISVLATDATSIGRYGKWYWQESRSDVIEQQTLDDTARELMRPSPVRVITFSPDARLAPLPWDDYDMGDTVQFYARRAALTEQTSARVNAFTVVVDENGYEATEIPNPTTPEEEATLRAGLQVEVIS